MNATDNCHTTDDIAHPAGPRFARPALVLLVVGVGGGSAAANAMDAFVVLSAVSIGESDTHTGLATAAASVANLAVRLGIGVRADRRRAWEPAPGRDRANGAIGPLLLAMVDPR